MSPRTQFLSLLSAAFCRGPETGPAGCQQFPAAGFLLRVYTPLPRCAAVPEVHVARLTWLLRGSSLVGRRRSRDRPLGYTVSFEGNQMEVSC